MGDVAGADGRLLISVEEFGEQGLVTEDVSRQGAEARSKT